MLIVLLGVNNNVKGESGNSAGQLDDVREEHSPRREGLCEVFGYFDETTQRCDEPQGHISSLPSIHGVSKQYVWLGGFLSTYTISIVGSSFFLSSSLFAFMLSPSLKAKRPIMAMDRHS